MITQAMVLINRRIAKRVFIELTNLGYTEIKVLVINGKWTATGNAPKKIKDSAKVLLNLR